MILNMNHTITTIYRILFILLIQEKEVALVQVKTGTSIYFYIFIQNNQKANNLLFRYYDNHIKNKKVNNLLQYSTLSCPAQRTNYTHEDEEDKIFHENYADDEDELYPRTSSAMNSRIEKIKDNNIKVNNIVLTLEVHKIAATSRLKDIWDKDQYILKQELLQHHIKEYIMILKMKAET